MENKPKRSKAEISFILIILSLLFCFILLGIYVTGGLLTAELNKEQKVETVKDNKKTETAQSPNSVTVLQNEEPSTQKELTRNDNYADNTVPEVPADTGVWLVTSEKRYQDDTWQKNTYSWEKYYSPYNYTKKETIIDNKAVTDIEIIRSENGAVHKYYQNNKLTGIKEYVYYPETNAVLKEIDKDAENNVISVKEYKTQTAMHGGNVLKVDTYNEKDRSDMIIYMFYDNGEQTIIKRLGLDSHHTIITVHNIDKILNIELKEETTFSGSMFIEGTYEKIDRVYITDKNTAMVKVNVYALSNAAYKDDNDKLIMEKLYIYKKYNFK